jgi:hypothetical protein
MILLPLRENFFSLVNVNFSVISYSGDHSGSAACDMGFGLSNTEDRELKSHSRHVCSRHSVFSLLRRHRPCDDPPPPSPRALPTVEKVRKACRKCLQKGQSSRVIVAVVMLILVILFGLVNLSPWWCAGHWTQRLRVQNPAKEMDF